MFLSARFVVISSLNLSTFRRFWIVSNLVRALLGSSVTIRPDAIVGITGFRWSPWVRSNIREKRAAAAGCWSTWSDESRRADGLTNEPTIGNNCYYFELCYYYNAHHLSIKAGLSGRPQLLGSGGGVRRSWPVFFFREAPQVKRWVCRKKYWDLRGGFLFSRLLALKEGHQSPHGLDAMISESVI